MTKQELAMRFDQLGLTIPEAERDELVAASHLIEKISASVKKSTLDIIEPAHVVLFPKDKGN